MYSGVQKFIVGIDSHRWPRYNWSVLHYCRRMCPALPGKEHPLFIILKSLSKTRAVSKRAFCGIDRSTAHKCLKIRIKELQFSLLLLQTLLDR